jgi:hypothetical protein
MSHAKKKDGWGCRYILMGKEAIINVETLLRLVLGNCTYLSVSRGIGFPFSERNISCVRFKDRKTCCLKASCVAAIFAEPYTRFKERKRKSAIAVCFAALEPS